MITKRAHAVAHQFRHAPARARFARDHPEVADRIHRVRAERLTYLSADNLRDLATTVLAADSLPGVILEAGTALGGSAVVLCAAKTPKRPLKLYDVFGMIPPPSDRDGADVHGRYAAISAGVSTGIKGDVYYGYHEDLLTEVEATFARYDLAAQTHHVEFVQGRYEDTMPGNIDFPVAVAHIDCDWYDSVMTCLEAITPSLVIGGTLVFDDYGTWSGCKDAVNQFFARPANTHRFEWIHNRTRLHIQRSR